MKWYSQGQVCLVWCVRCKDNISWNYNIVGGFLAVYCCQKGGDFNALYSTAGFFLCTQVFSYVQIESFVCQICLSFGNRGPACLSQSTNNFQLKHLSDAVEDPELLVYE